MRILGIETSCDETSVALLEAEKTSFTLKEHVVSSQIATHTQYGGVVPEIAARMHSEVLQPLLEKSLGRDTLDSVDLIAVTAGPGLITSLMVGVQAAKTLSYILGKPLVGVNHLEGHIYALWLTHQGLYRKPKEYFPALVLIVSGGHTEFVIMQDHGTYELLGQTVDDAAGEAFDKVAKILDLGYPGGPIISKRAATGDPKAIKFPRPMLHSADYNVSFSGLKTAVLYYLEGKGKISQKDIPDIAASFQQAVIDTLMNKIRKANEEYSPNSLMLVGGVSANTALRQEFQKFGEKADIPVFSPDMKFTGDNAAMIAAAGYFRRREASTSAWKTLAFDPQLEFIS